MYRLSPRRYAYARVRAVPVPDCRVTCTPLTAWGRGEPACAGCVVSPSSPQGCAERALGAGSGGQGGKGSQRARSGHAAQARCLAPRPGAGVVARASSLLCDFCTLRRKAPNAKHFLIYNLAAQSHANTMLCCSSQKSMRSKAFTLHQRNVRKVCSERDPQASKKTLQAGDGRLRDRESNPGLSRTTRLTGEHPNH